MICRSVPLICPLCRNILLHDVFALDSRSDLVCGVCAASFAYQDGCVDFTGQSQERDYYVGCKTQSNSLKNEPIDFEELGNLWVTASHPEMQIYMHELGQVHDKVILLLGNGMSVKELYFLKRNNCVVYSDLALNAVLTVKSRFDWGNFSHKVAFHSIDAYNIPLADASVDIVLGYAFVHHLENLELFFNEIYRVLRTGGRCLFYDSAYSHIWQEAKATVLIPAVRFSHWKGGISPMDLKATQRGGYFAAEIAEIKSHFGFADMTYNRFGLLYQIFNRGVTKLFGVNAVTDVIRQSLVPVLFWIDNLFSQVFDVYYRNTINLVWGFKK